MNEFYNQLIKFGLNRIKFYNNYVENSVVFNHQDTQLEIDVLKQKYEQNKNYDEEYFNELDEILTYKERLDDEIIINHRKSIVFLFFAFIEKELEIFCNTIGKDNSFKIGDLKGNSIFEKFKLYFKKIDNDFYKKVSNDINYLDKVRIIRNVITHQNNYIRENDYNKLKDFSLGRFELKEYNSLDDTKYFEIILSNKDFMIEIFDKAENFFNNLYK